MPNRNIKFKWWICFRILGPSAASVPSATLTAETSVAAVASKASAKAATLTTSETDEEERIRGREDHLGQVDDEEKEEKDDLHFSLKNKNDCPHSGKWLCFNLHNLDWQECACLVLNRHCSWQSGLLFFWSAAEGTLGITWVVLVTVGN